MRAPGSRVSEQEEEDGWDEISPEMRKRGNASTAPSRANLHSKPDFRTSCNPRNPGRRGFFNSRIRLSSIARPEMDISTIE
ncbi:hypothetical protein L596_018332 [Steinernema carpocapsae]|uniref:Uncharacterized protein n=1 Tax=Steinernema carpocapsae TaxID=34508 RepID=A0A4U5N4B3_STECR|nr:hypothetical protein L596_018332 [Steinernema carpocapsae]